MLPYLFPDLAAFATVADLITHLRTSDTRYRAALPAEFCAKNPPPMYITLYYLVTRLPDSLRSVRDHFLSLCPTTLSLRSVRDLRPSTAPQRLPLPSPPASSLPALADPPSDLARAASPTVTRLLATVVTDPSFESTAASALVAELVNFAAHCRLDYAASLVAESASVCPPSVGDPDAPDIPTPRSYAEAIEGPYSSQWQTAMDAEMASWKSTGTYVDEVPPPGANIVDGMWIFKVKRPPGSPPVFKRDYELHSLHFSTAFLQGSLHEEIWLRRPPCFTGSFPAGTQWSLRRPVYGLRQAPREWHDTLRTTLAALGFAPSTADPSLFLRTDTTLPPFYILVYIDDLVFATADTAGLAHVKSELQKRHMCTDLGELRSYLGLQITRDRARRTITLTQSHMVQQVLHVKRFNFTYSSPQATPLSTRHSLSTDESIEPSGPYPELVGCLMYLMTCTRPDLAYPLSILARYVAPGRHRPEHMDVAKRVLRYLCSTSGMGLVLGGRARIVLTGHADASWVDNLANQRSSQGYTFSLGSGFVSWRSTRSSSVLSFSCEAEIYAWAMAAQELRWLTYLLINLGEAPRSPPVLDHYARERTDVTAWKSRDAAACIALSILLPESEETHFTQVRTASEFLIAIKARYATPTTVSLGRLFLPFLFPDLASFERTADLITYLRSLNSSYRAACTDAQLALLPPHMAITIYFITTSLPDRLALVRDALLLKHPSELTNEVLKSALNDVESNLRSVASASGVVPPPLFHGCTVPQLPTFTASLATAATDVTAAGVTTSSRRWGDVASGGGGSAGAGGAPRAAAGDSPAAAGGGDARVRQPPTGLPAAGGGAAAWYLTRRQQQQQQPLPSQQPQQQQHVSGQGSGQRQLQRSVVHPPCTYHVLTGARRSQPCGCSHPPGQCFAQLTDTVRLAYGVDGPAPDWLPLVQTYGPALWGMSASQLVDLFITPHAMYAVVDSSASDSVYSSVVSLGASLAEVPVASVGTCVDTSPRAAPGGRFAVFHSGIRSFPLFLPRLHDTYPTSYDGLCSTG
ncbi:unnamed protein product [Closterium sp. NIES-54]